MKEYNRNKKETSDKLLTQKVNKQVSKPYLIEYRYWMEWRIFENGEIKFKEEPHWSEWSKWSSYKTVEDRDKALNNLLGKIERDTLNFKKEYRAINLV